MRLLALIMAECQQGRAVVVHTEERKRTVLRLVVEEHIRSAEPVGSEHAVLLEALRVSPATIRAVMATLEDEGLLTHRHTSGGRIPTDLGYRTYVNMLLESEPVSPAEREAVRRRFGEIDEAGDPTEQAARVLAEVTHYASVVAAPGPQVRTFRSLHLFDAADGRALAVIVTDAGTLQGRLIDLPQGVTASDLEALSRAITQRLQGCLIAELTPERLQQVVGEEIRHHQLMETLKRWLRRELARENRTRFRVEGARFLVREPEFSRPEAATRVLGALEEEDLLAQALADAPREGLRVSIGAENPLAELRSCSVVAATYSIGGRVGGSVALVGPTRMRYRRAMAAVRCVADRLSEALRDSA
jgi:heat-inducible transcriptional repressor